MDRENSEYKVPKAGLSLSINVPGTESRPVWVKQMTRKENGKMPGLRNR